MVVKAKVRAPRSKAEFRVFLAKDALRRMKLGQILAVPGRYIQFVKKNANGEIMPTFEARTNEELQAHLAREDNLCQTCLLGGLLVPYIVKKDGMSTDSIRSRTTNVEKLGAYFSEKQLAIMELAFEANSCRHTVCRYEGPPVGYAIDIRDFPKRLFTNEEIEALVKFANKYKVDNDRFIAIMKNIVRNKGTFVLRGVK